MLSHLYIVESKNGLIKIGRSKCPKRRIAEIAKATGTAVVKQYLSPLCLNAQKIERYLHKHFAKHRQEGEWFKVKFQTAVKEAKKQEFQTEEPSKALSFEFESNQLRTMVDEKGILWFVAKDVCNVLQHSDVSMACRILDDDEKGTRKVCTLGGTQRMLCVNESGFYVLVIRSNKPQAKKFRKWVTSEVLPSIRKTGQYSLPKQQLKGKVEQKTFENFIADCFIPDSTNKERARDIYLVYQGWCLQNKCEARTIQWVGMQLRKQGYNKSKCPPNGVACWHGFRLNNLACPANPSSLEDLQSYLSALSKNLAAGMEYSNAELLSLVNTANQKVMAIQ
ncbi:BRO family protein [Thiotrichales bacterium HSG1]|nr:BRO family protein [Thiotrichales bacterium HSG1]